MILAACPKTLGSAWSRGRTGNWFGFELQVFRREFCWEFIRIHLGSRYEKAFDKCYHPSMKSDYFRYSYVSWREFYVDADDVYHGTTIDHLFTRWAIEASTFLLRHLRQLQMVPPSVFVNPGANQLSWIFYFNTTPLIAVRR